eukprot:Selendium_serpulae@DN4843_c0_g1_i1.p1
MHHSQLQCPGIMHTASPSGASDNCVLDDINSQNLLTPVLTPPAPGSRPGDNNDAKVQCPLVITVPSFGVDDSPTRRRNLTRSILGALASPTPNSDTEVGLTPDTFLQPGKPQRRNLLDPHFACRTAHPGATITTATYSPYPQQLDSSVAPFHVASPPLTAEQHRRLQFSSPAESNGSKFDGGKPVRRKRSASCGGGRRRSSGSGKPRRKTQRPRQHSIDPAGRDIPIRGKVIFTYALTIASISLMLQGLIIGEGIAPMKENPMLGPSAEALVNMGGLVTELVREGDWWRLLWSPFLHAGIFHLVLNMALWVPMGKLVEPDWGVMRTFAIFVGGAFTGNLMSAVLDPFSVSVGSSGGIFAIMAAFVPYVIEFWHSIPRAKCLLILVVNDHYGCTAMIWTVRAVAIVFLIATWAPLLYFLFICPECYTAPGQLVTLNKHRRRLGPASS